MDDWMIGWLDDWMTGWLDEPIRRAGIAVASGMSVAPAMEALFAEMLRGCFDSLASVRTFAAPDTRKHRGRAMFHTMLAGVGRPFRQPGDGNLRQSRKPGRQSRKAGRLVHGWTEPEWVEFPPPTPSPPLPLIGGGNGWGCG